MGTDHVNANRSKDWGTEEYWLARAEEAVVMAAQFHEGEARRQMLSIAEGYRRLAERAARAASKSQT